MRILLAALLFVPAAAHAQQQQSRPGWPCVGTVDPAYISIAEGSGGTVMMFHPTEMDGIVAEMRASQQHEETVFRAVSQRAEGRYEFSVPVDSTMESVYFFVSVQCLQLAEVVTPSGAQLRLGSPGVEHHQFEAIHLFIVQKPDPGLWRVTAGGRGLFSIIVKAKTELRLSSVSVDGVERSSSTSSLEVIVDGSPRRVAFHLLSAAGAPIQAFDLNLADSSDESRTYKGQVTTPRTDFRVAITGEDPNGFPFQRVDNRLTTTDR